MVDRGMDVRRTVTTTDVRVWCEAFDRGDSVNAIAESHARPFGAVRHHLAKSGRLPDKHRRTCQSMRIVELIEQGVSTAAIVERLGARVGAVYKLRHVMRKAS